MKKVFPFYFLLLLLLAGPACSKFSKIQKSESLEVRYNAAIKYYQAGDYYKSGVLLEELLPVIRGKQEAEIALFYYAYSHYYQRELMLSAYHFKRFHETYPRSQYAEECLFMYAVSKFEDSPPSHLDQTNSYDAIEALENFARLYPGSSYMEKCNNIQDILRRKLEKKAYENARLYYKIHQYKAAVIAFDSFRAKYPGSVHNEELGYLKIVCQYLLAKQSIEAKKKERYYDVIEYYQNFVDKYQNSKYIRQAEQYYDFSLQEIS